MAHSTQPKSILLFKSILSYVLLTCVAFFVVGTIRWPLVGDASLMHYIVFLMQHGMAPYRDIVDMNLPGSYLVEWAQMHVFGTGAMGLRLFDLSLMGVATIAMMAVAWPQDWFAGVYAAALFLLIHGRDGVDQQQIRHAHAVLWRNASGAGRSTDAHCLLQHSRFVLGLEGHRICISVEKAAAIIRCTRYC